MYQPPAWLLASPSLGEPDAYPVMFAARGQPVDRRGHHRPGGVRGHRLFGPAGHYFAHALVTATPEADFGPVLPAELWRADLWQREPGQRAELPELPGPPRPGPIDPAGAQAFLDAARAGRPARRTAHRGQPGHGGRPAGPAGLP